MMPGSIVTREFRVLAKPERVVPTLALMEKVNSKEMDAITSLLYPS